MGNLTDKIVR